MQTSGIRVVHYLNQFFGGMGGEDRASIGPQVKNGPCRPWEGLGCGLR